MKPKHPSSSHQSIIMIILLLLICITITNANIDINLNRIENEAVQSILQDLPSSLRGSFELSQLKQIRQKLRSLDHHHSQSKGEAATTALRQLNGELPPNDPKSTWLLLSDEDLSILSRDSSFLHVRQQHKLNGAYVSRRRTNALPVISGGGGIHSLLLRGKKRKQRPQQQRQQQTSRNLSVWTTHGDVNVIPAQIVDGEVVYHDKPVRGEESVEMENSEFLLMGYDDSGHKANEDDEEEGNNEDTDDDNNDDEYMQDLYTRLNSAMEVTKRLEQNYAKYDTNSEFTYSDPRSQQQQTTSYTNADSFASSDLGDMVQHAALDSDRQRLLTGSYAVWQWYDRNNLAGPGNMDFKKVSRVNYAFFQPDGDGYLFGTDSWADPNILFGPYDFAVNTDKLPPECKGGRGRDDGKPINATVDEFAIYEQQQQQQQPGLSGGNDGSSAGKEGGETNKTNNEDNVSSNADNSTSSNNSRRTQKGNGSYQYPDYTKDPPCEFFEQCHRNFPNAKSCNTHHYREGLIHIAHTAGAQVYPSIGGWTLSNSFPAVAADPKKRLRFARQCVDLIAEYGFDGIDIDWEYPGYEPHGGSAEDRNNFNELLLDIRVALNEYQEQTGDAPIGGGAFGLTAALPCGPANIEFLDVSFLSQVLNGMNLMTFDFHNEQDPITGVASPLYDQGWGEKGLSVDGCVRNYFSAGAGLVSNKISIGVPFYGKTYSYANELNAPHSNTNGLFAGNDDQANWPQDLGTPVFYNMLDTMIKGSMVCKRHEPTKSAYAYFKDGSGLVTYDDAQSVCNKAEYVNSKLLGGLFVWELSGDLLDTLATPLLDALNRKLEEINFDCTKLRVEEDCSQVELPPPAAKGSAQVQVEVEGDIINMTELILDHLEKAEAGELASRGYGALTREVFMMRAYDGSFFPSYTYRYDHFVDALAIMSVTGVSGETFFMGYGENGQNGRQLQADNSTDKSTSLVYGLVNIAAFLAQAMTESIIHDACDELNVQPLPNSTDDGIGLDDGHDHFRFPISNACGQNGRSYQDEQCKLPEDSIYDCANQLNSEEFASVEVTAVSRSRWPGAPGPFYCGPKSSEGTGFWDAAVGRENGTVPLANDVGRTDVESCCFWGRGCLSSVKGTCMLGKLNYHLGANKASREGKSKAMFPDVNFCLDPGQICAGLYSTKLRWIVGMYHWIENVQSYDEDGFNYIEQLDAYVADNLEDSDFFVKLTRIHLFGCHLESCSTGIPDMEARMRNFEKALSALNLQFLSVAKAEPPFKTFPGQVPPTKPPVGEVTTKPPTGSPVTTIENVVTQVRLFMTGVPPDSNMTNSELKVFDGLMLELLVPRLKTANVDVTAVKTVHQKPGSDFKADSNFNSQSGDGEEAVLEVILDVTLSYYPPEPDGWRDWSIYLKSWIESFGNTLVDIFTSPKNPQHPETNSKFWDELSDVSALSVPPGGLVPEEIPTPPPTYIVIPEQSATNKAIMGMGVGVGVVAFCIFVLFGCYTYRKLQQGKKRVIQRKEYLDYDDMSYGLSSKGSSFNGQSRRSRYSRNSKTSGNEYNQRQFRKLLDGIKEGSESDSSSDSSSSSSDSSSEEGSVSRNSSSSSSSSSSSGEGQSRLKIAYAQAPLSPASTGNTSASMSASQDMSQSQYSASTSPSQDMGSASMGTRSASMATRSESRSQYSASTSMSQRTDDGTSDASENRSFVFGESQASASLATSEGRSRSQYSAATSVSQRTDDRSNASENRSFAFGMGSESMSRSQASRSQASRSQASRSHYSNGTAIEEEEYMEIVKRVAANDPTLKIIALDNREIIGYRDDGERLWSALVNNQYVECLSLRNSNITDAQISSLSMALMDNRSVSRLWLENNIISSDGAEYLVSALESNGRINEVRLEGNPDIDEKLLDDIESILGGASVGTNDEDNLGFVVEQIFNNDPSLRELNLSEMFIGSRCDALFDALSGNTYVKALDLSSNEIDDDCVSSLSFALMENSSIQHISLSNNLISNEGIEYLRGLLETNTTIRSIDLDGNDIDDSIMKDLDDILKKRQVRSSSSMASSLGTESPLAGIVQSLRENDPNLVELCLDNLDLTDCPEAEAMIDALAGNTTVMKLSLVNTCFDDSLAAPLSLSLVENNTLTHILLRDNLMTDEGCDYFLGTLDSNTTLVHLDLEGNYIDEKLLDEIDAILSERTLPAESVESSRATTPLHDGYSTTGSVSSASVSMASRVSSAASSFMKRSGSRKRDNRASAKLAGKEII